jgi:hypothetical protein
MTPEQHDKYIEAIEALQAKIADADFSDLNLTDEEQAAYDALDPRYVERAESELAKFIPGFTEYDARGVVMKKALAVFALTVVPVIEEAYEMGVKTTD